MRPRFLPFVWFPLLLLALSARSGLAQKRPPTPVIVAEVLERKVAEDLTFVGTVQPRHNSVVASETEGKVVARYKEAGQAVETGEILFRLENDPLRASLIEALADLKLEKLNYQQSTKLLNEEAVAEQQVRDTEYQLERARAKLQDIEARIADLSIRAPFKGHIAQTFTEIGAWIGRGDQVARLISIDTVRVYANVPERQVDRLRLGAEADIFVEALGTEPIPGRIVAILVEGYEDSHTFPVVVETTNPTGRIRSHMSARVRFHAGQPGAVLLVHKDALVDTPTGPVVYLAVDDKAVSRSLKPGRSYEGYIAVEGDLKPGDLAIVRGNERLFPGQSVRVVRKQQ